MAKTLDKNPKPGTKSPRRETLEKGDPKGGKTPDGGKRSIYVDTNEGDGG